MLSQQSPEIDFFGGISQMLAEPTHEKVAKEVRKDLKKWIERNLYIKTKESTIAPFKLNKSQQEVCAWVQYCFDNEIPIRIITLKARRLGLSTFFEGVEYAITSTHPNVHSRIIAHDSDSAANIYGMTELFYDMANNKPMRNRRNRQELTFENPKETERQANPGLRSQIKVDSASAKIRSGLTHMVHLSEVAFYPDPAGLLAGLLAEVPYEPLTMVAYESTANGIGNFFHAECEKAERGESDYKFFFFPWFDEPTYRLPLSEEESKNFTLDEEEIRIQKKYSLDMEQLKWRRMRLSELDSAARTSKDPRFIGLSALQLFRQEYPCEPREAFISTGRPVFDTEALTWYEETQVREPKLIGNLSDTRDGRVILDPNPRGFLKVWEPPAAGEGYIIGMDIAEGIGTGDYTSMHVISQKGYNVVAHWHGHIDPDLAIDEAEKLGMYYNRAFIVPERNNQGLVVCIGLQNRHYPRLYIRRTMGNRFEKQREEVGWRTDKASKPVMIADLSGDVRDHTLGIPCQDTIDEMFKFVRDEKGSMNAQEGSHDDRVISLALALQGHAVAPVMHGRKSRNQSKKNRTPKREVNSYTGY